MRTTAQILVLLWTLVFISSCNKNDENPVQASPRGLADPSFIYISGNWYPQAFNMRMDNIWQSQGINAKGQNYYFFAKPTGSRTYSDRFNPQSNYFQTWFGAYTIEDQNNATYALSNNVIDAKAIIQLAVADQTAWLLSFGGNSEPSVSIDTSVDINISRIQIDVRSGWKITGRLNSNVDVGVNNSQSGYPPLLIVPDSAWRGFLGSYEHVKLDVVSYVWYAPENKELNVVYYNGVEYDDVHNSHHSTLTLISAELDSMALSVTVRE